MTRRIDDPSYRARMRIVCLPFVGEDKEGIEDVLDLLDLIDELQATIAGAPAPHESPTQSVNRFIAEMQIPFEDVMGCTPFEHLREYEQWRRHQIARKHKNGDAANGA